MMNHVRAVLVGVLVSAAWAASPALAQDAGDAPLKVGGEASAEPKENTAQPSPSLAEPSVTLFHVPPTPVEALGRSRRLVATVSQDWEATSIWVAVRALGGGEYVRIPFKRAEDLTFHAVLPGEMIQAPGLEYYIGSVDRGGVERLHFATPERPHPLIVRGESPEDRMALRLARHDGHRSRFQLVGDLTAYGSRAVRGSELNERITEEGVQTEADSDWFWRTELSYTYRPLKLLYDFQFGVGVMRGSRAAVALEDGEEVPVGLEEGASADEPGLNYGYGGISLELLPNLSTDLRLILGASELGFVAGVGGLVRLGRIAGTRLEVGGEVIQDAGALGFFRFAWDTVERVPMALAVELTTWPDSDANPRATRLLYDLGFEVTDALTVTGRVGYATRLEAIDPGWVVGTGAAWEF